MLLRCSPVAYQQVKSQRKVRPAPSLANPPLLPGIQVSRRASQTPGERPRPRAGPRGTKGLGDRRSTSVTVFLLRRVTFSWLSREASQSLYFGSCFGCTRPRSVVKHEDKTSVCYGEASAPFSVLSRFGNVTGHRLHAIEKKKPIKKEKEKWPPEVLAQCRRIRVGKRTNGKWLSDVSGQSGVS